MKVRFNRWYNALLTVLLSMLGFESCSSESLEEYGSPIVEYGCPHADYIVKGTVTDEAGKPVQGIKITAPASSDTDAATQTALTDGSGAFKLKEFSNMRGNFLIAEDIDGDANGGEFKSDTLNVLEIKNPKQIEKGKGWYNGKFEVTADFKLKKK